MADSGATSNLGSLDDIFDAMDDLVSFSMPGSPNGTIAADIAYIVGSGIQERTLYGQDEDGGGLERNRGDYGERKRAKGLPVGIGFSDRDDGGPNMLDIAQMVGRVKVSGDEMVQELGTTDHVQDKVAWFHHGNSGRNQPPRPAFGLDDAIIDRVMDHIEDQIETVLRDL